MKCEFENVLIELKKIKSKLLKKRKELRWKASILMIDWHLFVEKFFDELTIQETKDYVINPNFTINFNLP